MCGVWFSWNIQYYIFSLSNCLTASLISDTDTWQCQGQTPTIQCVDKYYIFFCTSLMIICKIPCWYVHRMYEIPMRAWLMIMFLLWLSCQHRSNDEKYQQWGWSKVDFSNAGVSTSFPPWGHLEKLCSGGASGDFFQQSVLLVVTRAEEGSLS